MTLAVVSGVMGPETTAKVKDLLDGQGSGTLDGQALWGAGVADGQSAGVADAQR